LAFKTTIYYTDKQWLAKAKICAALNNRSFSGLVKDLISEAIANNASKSYLLNPHQHNPPGIYEEKPDQRRKFMRMNNEELLEYGKYLETHVTLYKKRKTDVDPLW